MSRHVEFFTPTPCTTDKEEATSLKMPSLINSPTPPPSSWAVYTYYVYGDYVFVRDFLRERSHCYLINKH